MIEAAGPSARRLTEAETLALRVVFGSPEQSLDSWHAYKDRGWDLDSLCESNAASVMPHLSKRLSQLMPDEPWLGKLRGYYRHVWAHNQFAIQNLTERVCQLRSNQVDCIVLNDANVVLQHYHDMGMRKIDGQQLLVKPEQFEPAQRLLRPRDTTSARSARIDLVHDLPFNMAAQAHQGRTVTLDLGGETADGISSVCLLLMQLKALKQSDIPVAWILDTAQLLSASYSGEDLRWLRETIVQSQEAFAVMRVWHYFKVAAKSIFLETRGAACEALESLPISGDEIAYRAKRRAAHVLRQTLERVDCTTRSVASR